MIDFSSYVTQKISPLLRRTRFLEIIEIKALIILLYLKVNYYCLFTLPVSQVKIKQDQNWIDP